MSSVRSELHRLWQSLVLRGAAMLALGVAATIWPEPVLIGAMMTAGVVAALFGGYEISVALELRHRAAVWRIVLLDGIAAALFGVLTVVGPLLPIRLALTLVAAWLVFHAGIAWSAALFAWPVRSARLALVGWGCLNVGLASVTLLFPDATVFALLLFGAVYAALFGAGQIAAGAWVRRSEQRMLAGSAPPPFAALSP